MTLKWALGGYMVRSWDRTYSSDTSGDAATIVASVGGGQDSQPSESYHILGDSGTPNLLLPQDRVQYRWSPDTVGGGLMTQQNGVFYGGKRYGETFPESGF